MWYYCKDGIRNISEGSILITYRNAVLRKDTQIALITLRYFFLSTIDLLHSAPICTGLQLRRNADVRKNG